MERKLDVMPANMHVPGLFSGSNGPVYLWGTSVPYRKTRRSWAFNPFSPAVRIKTK